jgi:hypothetical protein
MSLADENGMSFWVPEFDHADRPDGWNAWIMLLLSPAPAAESSPPPILTKSSPRS